MATGFNANVTRSFFENGPQMAHPRSAVTRLANEGLANLDDFADFKEDELQAAFKNLRTAIPGVPGVPAVLNGAGNEVTAAVPAIASINLILISAKYSHRLLVAFVAYCYYIDVQRAVDPVNMNYTQVLKDFYVEHEAIISLSKEDKPNVPALHKNTTIIRWVESFKDCLYRTYGLRDAPLLYVIRDEVDLPNEADDPLKDRKAYGNSGSVLQEMITRLDHTHSLYKSDNNTVYSYLKRQPVDLYMPQLSKLTPEL